MDWDNLIADETFFGQAAHYTKGRGGNAIEYIVLHHNGGFNSIQESIFRITGGKAEKFVDTWKVALITASAGVLIAAIAKIIISG